MAPPPTAEQLLRHPTISLEGMPVIELTQQPRPAVSIQMNKAGGECRVNSDENDCANGNGGALVVGPGSNKHSKLVPKPDDEPSLICKLLGYSLSTFTELCGWSFLQPMKFFNIKSTTHLHSMTDGRGEVINAAADLKDRCITLKEMEHLLGGFNQVVSSPVFVQVVAKRKVDVTSINGRILVIPLVIIADRSGYCSLCSMNEGLATVYNEVEVGDQLLITRCVPKLPRRIYHRGLFSGNMFLCLELKLQYHSVRNHYIWRFSPLRQGQFAMPLELFDVCCQVKLPNELETEFSLPPTGQPPWRTPLPSEQYYDLIGVVTFVGRIERFQNMDAQNVECLVNGELKIRKITRFLQYRWIYMVDRSSQPFPVKVYVNNATRPHQGALIPGAILVLSHCQTVSCPYTGKVTSTSHFSQMYLEGNIEKYFMLHPSAFRDKTGELLNRQNYTQVMLRPEIQLTIGGTHVQKISDPEKFLNFYHENVDRVWKDIPAEKPMIRRESRRIFFEGIIFRVLYVSSEDKHNLHYVHTASYQVELHKKTIQYTVVENFYPFPRYINTSWYSFQRKLPAYQPFLFQQSRCRDIVKKIVASYKPFCGPLLMPAEMPEDGTIPPMSAFEKVDGAPYLLIDIVNKEAHIWYTVIWKSRQISIEEKLKKVNTALDKKIICFAEIFCIEPEAPLEVNLFDFVIVGKN